MTESVGSIFKKQANGVSFNEHVNVTIHCYEANLKRDDDNVLSGASKIILDALQFAGIIKKDSPKYCHVMAERFQSKDKRTYKTIVYITRGGDCYNYGEDI